MLKCACRECFGRNPPWGRAARSFDRRYRPAIAQGHRAPQVDRACLGGPDACRGGLTLFDYRDQRRCVDDREDIVLDDITDADLIDNRLRIRDFKC